MRTTDTIHCVTRPVNYSWSTPDGTICHGHTVVVAADRRRLKQALRDFWRRHPHVTASKSSRA